MKVGGYAIQAGAELGEADLSRADLRDADLRWAELGEANLRWANLSGANLGGANLSWANLRETNLRGAELSRANLRGAELSRANLSAAELGGADLSRANLSAMATVIDAGQDLRGYRFVAIKHPDGLRIAAGCRWLTLSEALEHWKTAHADDLPLRAECLAKVQLIESVASARGWIGHE